MNSNSTDPREIRKFGVLALGIFSLLSAVAWWRGHPGMQVFFGALAALGLLFLALPGPMAPVHRGWLAVGHFIGQVITKTILGLAFFLVIVPFGLARKLFEGKGRVILKKRDPKAATYWVPRTEPAQSRKRFTRRY
ncbi:MAG: hypothetical protein KKA60_01765 [Proteobacteria bacterium]|nr:hypothetical protein [Pseudomonadota bacterium]